MAFSFPQFVKVEKLSESSYIPCLFCLKNAHLHKGCNRKNNSNSKLLSLFFKLLQRTVGYSETFSEDPVQQWTLCHGCTKIVESVTKFFHQVQCFQLQLNWNLDKLKNVMMFADRVPSRVTDLQEKYNNDTISKEVLDQLRQTIKQRLRRHSIKYRLNPKVLLYGGTRNKNASQHEPSTSNTKFRNDIGDTNSLEISDPLLRNNFYLAWIVAFITITKLCGQHTEDDLTRRKSIFNSINEDVPIGPTSFNEEMEVNIMSPSEDFIEMEIDENLETMSKYIPVEIQPPFSPELSPLSGTQEPSFDKFENQICANDEIQNNVPIHASNTDTSTSVRQLRRIYKCALCSMTFSTLSRLEVHKETSKCIDKDDAGRSRNHNNDEDDDMDSAESHLTDLSAESCDEEVEFLDDEFRVKNELSDAIESSMSPTNRTNKKDTMKGKIKRGNKMNSNQKFVCSSCDITFESINPYSLHMRYLHSNGTHSFTNRSVKSLNIFASDIKLDAKFTLSTCPLVGCESKVFVDKTNVEIHNSLHGEFKCTFCEYECNFAEQLLSHEMEHGSTENGKKKISCSRCPFETATDLKYYNHFIEIHLKLKTIMKQATCGICKEQFAELEVPLYHFVNQHDLSRLESLEKAALFTCSKSDCEAYFIKESQLFRHTQHHSRSKGAAQFCRKPLLFTCNKCPLKFPSKPSLTCHQSSVHEKVDIGTQILTSNGITINDLVRKSNAKYSCKETKCKAIFFTIEELEHHSKLHGTFPCQICPEVIKFAPDLPLHEMEHGKSNKTKTGSDFKYQCSRCDLKTDFKNKYVHHHVEKHLSLVTDTIKCPICRLSFYEADVSRYCKKRRIYLHYMTHHDASSLEPKKSFVKCGYCDAHFVKELQVHSHNLKIHNIHTSHQKYTSGSMGRFPCEICKQGFISPRFLAHHKKTKHNEKRCEISLNIKTIRNQELSSTDVKLSESFSRISCPQTGCESKIFTNNKSFEFHQSLHGEFTCNNCDFQTNFAAQFAIHELTKHPSSTRDDKNKTCSRCDFKSDTGTEADNVRHFIEKHLNISLQQSDSECDICSARFPTLEVPFNHYINEHDLNILGSEDDVVKCSEDGCKAYFVKKIQLIKHIRTNHNNLEATSDGLTPVAIHKCQKCSKQFSSKTALKWHQATTHGNKGQVKNTKISPEGITVTDLVTKKNAKYFCPVEKCEAKFFTDEELTTHSKLHGTFTCNLCPVSEKFAPDLAIHESSHSPQKKYSDIYHSYGCSRCSFKSWKKILYIQHHLETHLNLSGDCIRCPICQQSFDTDDVRSLERSVFLHYSITHDLAEVEAGSKVVKCDLCPAYFITESQLFLHKGKCHSDVANSYKTCKDCGKTLKCLNTLRLHRKKIHFVNEDDFDYVCDADGCGKKFECKIELDGHKEHCKKYTVSICPYCSKKFKCSKQVFELHLKTHEVKRPQEQFVCEECGKIFKKKVTLQIHKLHHVGPDGWQYVCEICSRKFARPENLKVHMRVHTKEKPFVCDICGEKYSHKHNWRSHMNNKHNANIITRKMIRPNFESRKGIKVRKHVMQEQDSESD